MEVSKGRKFWECINPFVFLMVTMIIVTICVSTGISIYSQSIGENALQTYYRVATSTLWCDLAFYLVIIVVKRKSVVFDKYKYEHKSSNWPLWRLILGVSAAFLFSLLVNVLIDAVGITAKFTTYTESVGISFVGQPPILLIIVIVILGPVAEEMIFRWMIFGRIRYYAGSKWAVLFSSMLFGLYHMNLVQFIFCTLLGAVLAHLYDKSGNIWVPIAAHMAVNLYGIIGLLTF